MAIAKVEQEEVDKLADELFKLVEAAQGFAFISDGEGAGMNRSQFFARVRGRLRWTRKSDRLIKKFLMKYGEFNEMEPG